MSEADIAPFTPFWFGGILVGGMILISSKEDWLKKVINPYDLRLGARELPLDAVLIRHDPEGVPVFTLEHRIGMSLRTWSEYRKLGLVTSVETKDRAVS